MNDGNKLACDESSSFKGSSLHSSVVLWILYITLMRCQDKKHSKSITEYYFLFSPLLQFICLIILPVQIFLFDNLSKTFWNNFRNLSQLDVEFWQAFERESYA